MIGPDLVSGLGRVCCGMAIPALGSLIAFYRRVDRHANYEGSVDPATASRRPGRTALLVGALVVDRESIE